MKILSKSALLLALAGTLAISAAAPSFARNGRVAAAAGIGFATGALIGAAAANSNAGYYYDPGPGYAYYPAPGYAYETEYAYPSGYAAQAYVPDAYAYAPARAFDGYDGRAYVGSDPDPRVRAHIRQEARDK
jgi:hypothetical protein